MRPIVVFSIGALIVSVAVAVEAHEPKSDRSAAQPGNATISQTSSAGGMQSQRKDDPAPLQWNWSSYEGKFPAAVKILAFPLMAETTGSRFARGLNPFRKADIKFMVSFYEMTLLCDGKEVPPIDRKKSSVEIPGVYAAKEGFLAFQGN